MAKVVRKSSSVALRKSVKQPKVKIVREPLVQPVVATLSRIDKDGIAYVSEEGGVEVAARSTVPLGVHLIGRSALVFFEKGDRALPIITGFIEKPGPFSEVLSADVDGQRLVLSAESEVTLKCGDAKITLTKQGKVLIQGAYVLSKSSGANKIKGASVEIN